MEFVNALLLGITALSGALSFLFGLLWKFATERIKELKIDLEKERKEKDRLRESVERDLERIVNSNIEVVRANNSILSKILDDGK